MHLSFHRFVVGLIFSMKLNQALIFLSIEPGLLCADVNFSFFTIAAT